MSSADDWRGRTILVTGGAGYLGSQLIRDLATDPNFSHTTIRILDNMQRDAYQGLMRLPEGVRFELVQTDLLDPAGVERAVQGVDAVVHLAALVRTPFSFDHPTWTEHTNHWGTAQLVERCLEAGTTRFIYASSASVYGPGGPHVEEARCHPVGPYSQSKLKAENAVEVASERGLAATIIRFATIYGAAPAARFDAVPNRFAYLAATERPIALHGSGEQVRAIVHVRDAATAVRLCLLDETRTAGNTYNAGTVNVTVNDIVDVVRASAPHVRVLPTDQHALAHFSLAISSERLRSLGWDPAVTLEEGISEVMDSIGPFQAFGSPTDLLE